MQPVNFYVVVPTRTGGGETNWPGFILFLVQGSLIFCNAINDTYIGSLIFLSVRSTILTQEMPLSVTASH